MGWIRPACHQLFITGIQGNYFNKMCVYCCDAKLQKGWAGNTFFLFLSYFIFHQSLKIKKKSCSSKCSVLLLFFFSVRSPSITIFLGYKLHHRFWHQHGGDMLPSLESNPLEFRITVISAGRCVCVFPTELLCYSTVKRKKKERKN